MGVRTILELQQEVAMRKKRQDELIFRINTFCQGQYGVSDYRSMVRPYIVPDRLGVCLARQIPTANVEHIALHLFAQWLCQQGIPAHPMPLSVIEDSYLHSNPGKKATIKLPLLQRNGSGMKVVWEDVIEKKERRNVDGKILSKILTKTGLFLPGFHATLREKVFGYQGVTMDLTEFFMELLANCAQNDCPVKPKTIFIETYNREWPAAFHPQRFANGVRPRPPAEWYYVPYLMLFVAGDWALVSTVEDDPEVTQWFDHATEVITEACGIGPLIIDSPKQVLVGEYHSNLLEIPIRFLDEGLAAIQPEIPWPSGDDLFHVLEDLEQQIIQLA